MWIVVYSGWFVFTFCEWVYVLVFVLCVGLGLTYAEYLWLVIL